MLNAAELRATLSYEPETGIFRWRKTLSNRRREGQIAGCICKRDGYNLIGVQGRVYKANRLAWLYMTGEWPAGLVDHANGNCSDDRWENLRLATASQNVFNSGVFAHNTSGYRGVYFSKQAKKWHARITYQRKTIHLGFYDNLEDAGAAFANAAKKYFGEFARDAA